MTLDVRARKVVVDEAGVETEVPMDDLVEVGVFAAAEGEGPGEALYLRDAPRALRRAAHHRDGAGRARAGRDRPAEPVDRREARRQCEGDHTRGELSVARALLMRS